MFLLVTSYLIHTVCLYTKFPSHLILHVSILTGFDRNEEQLQHEKDHSNIGHHGGGYHLPCFTSLQRQNEYQEGRPRGQAGRRRRRRRRQADRPRGQAGGRDVMIPFFLLELESETWSSGKADSRIDSSLEIITPYSWYDSIFSGIGIGIGITKFLKNDENPIP